MKMKKIKIAHLYYDLMNLYGENGNVRYLARALEKQGIDSEVHFLSIDDKIDFNKYDFYYIGMGSEDNKMIVLEDIMKYKEDIKKAIDNEKYFLVTGNAIDLFGKEIVSLDNVTIPTLDFFDYIAKDEDFRIVGEQLYEVKLDLKNNKILGFQNRNTILNVGNYNSLFNVIKGTGYKPDEQLEGIHKKNFFGTYLLGPILVRNPYFTDYIVKKICDDLGLKFKIDAKDMAYKAYNEYIKNFHGEQ
jgi:CobQ-like glutamine amidotransferase family enzyme